MSLSTIKYIVHGEDLHVGLQKKYFICEPDGGKVSISPRLALITIEYGDRVELSDENKYNMVVMAEKPFGENPTGAPRSKCRMLENELWRKYKYIG